MILLLIIIYLHKNFKIIINKKYIIDRIDIVLSVINDDRYLSLKRKKKERKGIKNILTKEFNHIDIKIKIINKTREKFSSFILFIFLLIEIKLILMEIRSNIIIPFLL